MIDPDKLPSQFFTSEFRDQVKSVFYDKDTPVLVLFLRVSIMQDRPSSFYPMAWNPSKGYVFVITEAMIKGFFKPMVCLKLMNEEGGRLSFKMAFNCNLNKYDNEIFDFIEIVKRSEPNAGPDWFIPPAFGPFHLI